MWGNGQTHNKMPLIYMYVREKAGKLFPRQPIPLVHWLACGGRRQKDEREREREREREGEREREQNRATIEEASALRKQHARIVIHHGNNLNILRNRITTPL